MRLEYVREALKKVKSEKSLEIFPPFAFKMHFRPGHLVSGVRIKLEKYPFFYGFPFLQLEKNVTPPIRIEKACVQKEIQKKE